jgi:hypothetical protein
MVNPRVIFSRNHGNISSPKRTPKKDAVRCETEFFCQKSLPREKAPCLLEVRLSLQVHRSAMAEAIRQAQPPAELMSFCFCAG